MPVLLIAIEAPASAGLLEGLLEGMVLAALDDDVPLPPLYEAGINYQKEPLGRERWQLPRETYRLRSGDCEDLCIYRVTELRRAGEDAWCLVRQTGPKLWHVLVAREDGSVECPSRALGMGK